MTSLGLWIDDPAASLRKPAFWDEVARHGIKTAALMMEGYGDGWDPKYTLPVLEVVKKHALSRDIEIVLTVWPEPNPKYLDALEKNIGVFLKTSGAAGLEFDAEGNWLPKKVNKKAFKDLDQAGDRLVEVYKKIEGRYDVRTEVTTYPFHAENSAKADIANHCSRLLPQAYSVRNRTEGAIEWDGPWGPGRMQKLTLDKALQVPNEQKLSCGLAAYDQVWPNRKGEEAMKIAFDTALAYNPVEIRFWSSKWVLGVKKNGYASRFLLSLNG